MLACAAIVQAAVCRERVLAGRRPPAASHLPPCIGAGTQRQHYSAPSIMQATCVTCARLTAHTAAAHGRAPSNARRACATPRRPLLHVRAAFATGGQNEAGKERGDPNRLPEMTPEVRSLSLLLSHESSTGPDLAALPAGCRRRPPGSWWLVLLVVCSMENIAFSSCWLLALM